MLPVFGSNVKILTSSITGIEQKYDISMLPRSRISVGILDQPFGPNLNHGHGKDLSGNRNGENGLHHIIFVKNTYCFQYTILISFLYLR